MISWVAKLLMPILGTVSADLIWFVSIQEILDARKRRDIGELDPVPYVVGLSSTIAWLIYGVCIQDVYVFWSNFPGVCLMSFYCNTILTILYEHANTPEAEAKYYRVERMYMFMIMFFAQVPLVFIAIQDRDTTTSFFGMLATAANILFYMSPCTVIYNVVRTQDASQLFLPMLCANGACSACWFMYGLFGLNDVWLYTTNGIGMVLQGSFIIARLWYGNGKEKEDKSVTTGKLGDGETTAGVRWVSSDREPLFSEGMGGESIRI